MTVRDAYIAQTVEILSALKKLGEELSAEEEAYLASHMTESMAAFEGASADIGPLALSINFSLLRIPAKNMKENLLTAAASSVKRAQK